MIQFNPRYEVIFAPENIDQDCDRIAWMMSDEGNLSSRHWMLGCISKG